MQIGLHALGIGPGAGPGVVAAVAAGAEAAGFATLWTGEHVVMVEGPDAPYPYADDGRIAVPVGADWLDPWVTLAFAAAATSRIRLATGVLLLPEHHPLVVAKQAASLDVLSGGRVTLGVGAGWSEREYEALGVPFAGRGRRLREHVAALRAVWTQEVAGFDGQTVRFSGVRSHPKPLQPHLPIVLGGNSDRALQRAADYGDGWYGFHVAVDELPGRLDRLAGCCRAAGRDPADLRLAAALADADPSDLDLLAGLGLDELVLVATPPDDPVEVDGWIADLARHWQLDDHR